MLPWKILLYIQPSQAIKQLHQLYGVFPELELPLLEAIVICVEAFLKFMMVNL